MILKRILCACLCMLAVPSIAQAQDKLTLKNGDILTGHITSQSDGGAVVQTQYGVLHIPSADIAFIESKLSSVPSSGPDMDDDSVAAITPAAGEEDQADLWGAQWSGNVNLGASLKTGNSENSAVNADAMTKAKWDKHRAEFTVDYNREEDDSNVTVDNRSVGASHDYFFAEKWFWENAVEFEQDDIELLDLRMILNSGLGYQFYEQDDLNLKLVAGPGYLYQDYEDGTKDEELTAHAGLDYDQKFYDDMFRVFHNSDVSMPFDESEAFLFQSKSGIRIPIKKGVVASAEVAFDWDNDPAAGTKEDDTSYALKLGYEW